MKGQVKNNQAGPTMAKNSNKDAMRAKQPTKPKQDHRDKDSKYGTEDEKNYEVGLVEIASNLSDLSGSTGDGESNAEDVRQMSTSTRNADAKEFEILIQAKHAEACKAMGVSRELVV